MKHFFIALGLLLPFGLGAQITINQTHMPVSGDTIRYSSVNIVGFSFDPKQKGANQSWDFSSAKGNGQGLYEYLSANKTPYLFYFFNQIGLKTADSIGVSTFTFKNIYSFYSKSSTVFKAEGLGYSVSGIPLAANYTDEDEIYQFPLSFNDSDVSTFRFVFSIPTQSQYAYVQAGKRTNVVDGWGSIKTPYKTYNSVIRVRTVMDEVDTLVTQFVKIPIPRKQVIYKWLSTSEKIPVMEITGTEINNTFTATQIRYRDSFTGQGSDFKPRARFDVSKTTGFVNADTFLLTDATTPFATGFQWQITPTVDVQYVNGTSATSRNPQVVFTQRGKFSVSHTASNFAGTDDTLATDVITIAYGAATQNLQNQQVELFPNPAMDFITVPGIHGEQRFVVYSLAGAKRMQGTLGNHARLDISALTSGMYILEINGMRSRFQVIRP